MENHLKEIMASITREVHFRLREESVPRIRKCLGQLTDEEIWRRPNSNLVSVGNLVVHLCGNVRQYVMFGLGNEPDHRQRQAEFDQREIIPREKLLEELDRLMVDVKRVLNTLTPDVLTKTYNIQGIDITGFGILMHVVEHFSYHVGQITWYTKLVKDVDLGYYEGHDLNITG